MLAPGDFTIYGPFWSDAHKAYRVEWWEQDDDCPGGFWGSSFLCSREEDASRIAGAARSCKSRRDWLELREMAVELAAQQKEGFLYRVMIGGVDHYPMARA